MSFWDAEKMAEEQRRREEEEERRRANDDARRRKKRREVDLCRRKRLAHLKAIKKAKELLEREGLIDSDLIDEPMEDPTSSSWIPPKLNRGFNFAPGTPTVTEAARAQIQLNEAEKQRQLLEASQKGSAKAEVYYGPKLNRPF